MSTEKNHNFKATFADVLNAMVKHFGVKPNEVTRLFEVTIRCKMDGSWRIEATGNTDKDREMILSKHTDVSYLIKVQTIRRWNQSTQDLEPVRIPVLVRRLHDLEQQLEGATVKQSMPPGWCENKYLEFQSENVLRPHVDLPPPEWQSKRYEPYRT